MNANMSYFLKSGNTFKVTSKEALDLHEKLPAGNYVVKESMSGELYLEEIAKFAFKGKQYGDHTSKCERIFGTFMDRSACTGVMLTGEKGSGKSLLAKLVCIKAFKEGLPTIVINAPWCGDKFNAFLQNIQQPTIVLFDEFEKVYDQGDQQKILTLLDGVFPSKKLFILTCNDKWRVDSHMRNRPGRIYYMLDFKGLDRAFVTEYCEDNLKNKKYIERICNIAGLFSEFNFDMLKALVEEMNRYNEPPETVLKMLNVKPEFDAGSEAKFSVKLSVKGVPVEEQNMYTTQWRGNPLQSNIEIGYMVSPKDKDDGDPIEDKEVEFKTVDIKKIDPQNQTYIFVNDNNDTMVLTRIKHQAVNFYDAL